MKKAWWILLIALCVAVLLRLYPTLISGMPFSTDAWPLIRNSNLLLLNTPIPLNSDIFDDYNILMPASSLFGAVFAQVTAVPAITAMAIGIPLVAALTIPLYYLLSKKITQNTKIATIAALLLATAFPYILFTAGVTKETFASPLYITLILLFLLKHSWKNALLFSTLSIALVLTHQLTAFLTLGIIASISIAVYLSKTKTPLNSNKSNLTYLAILTTAAALYFGLYAYSTLPQAIATSDWLTVASYQIFVLAAAFYLVTVHVKKRSSSLSSALKLALGTSLIVLFMFLLTKLPILSGAPLLPFSYFVFALPFIVAVPLSLLALSTLYRRSSSLCIPFFWLLPILGFALYGVFANSPEGIGFAFRSLNFLLPPLIILISIGLYKLTKMTHNSKGASTKFVAAGIVLFLVTVNVYGLYAAVSLQEPYLGYFWRYTPSEYSASGWVALYNNNQTVAGDSKVYYLLDAYYGQTVDIPGGLRYLEDNSTAPQNFYIYSQMYQNGYVLYQGIPISLPDNWTDRFSDYNIIYANPEVTIYAK
jgi:hypothetical protein